MAYRKRTLRRMTPLQRRAARLANDCRSLAIRAQNIVIALGELERETVARRQRDGGQAE